MRPPSPRRSTRLLFTYLWADTPSPSLLPQPSSTRSVSDADAVAMSRHLVLSDGLFLGSSSACNLVACVRAVKAGLIPKGGTVVTILCDSGSRHYSKVRLERRALPGSSRATTS